MKTTSYEISKDLHEAGFRAESFFYAFKKDDKDEQRWSWDFEIKPWEMDDEDEFYPSYDLEAILESLPDSVEQHARITHLEINKGFVGYVSQTWDNDGLEFEKEENESLADTAALLLILLNKKQIIKLKGE